MSFVLPLIVVAVVAAIAALLGRRYLALRGPRLVECPETHEPAAVDVRAARAAVSGRFTLTDCSRWPERGTCGRECLAQIERAPEDCLVRSVVTKWYAGKSCSVCHTPLDTIDWFEKRPGVIDAEGVARPWPDIAPETLPSVLATQRPICFDCYVATTFRRERPDLVLDNPWRP